MTGTNPVDINRVLDDPRYAFELRTLETPEERAARLKREDDEARHRRNVFWAVFAVVIAAATIALLIMLLSTNVDNKEWARNVVAAIVAGLVGYVGGSAARKNQ